MQRYFITEGAKTTAGGTVVEGLKNFRIDGVRTAFEGHQVQCPACQTMGVIVCSGPRLNMQMYGRQFALSGDICRCKCDPLPQLIADQFKKYQIITTGDASVHGRAAPASTTSHARPTTATRASGPSASAISDMVQSSCERDWLFYQQQAQEVVAPGGRLIADPKLRNRRINSAYAQLWRRDNRFQWAGLAAFASKQVGCGLLHAAESIEKSRRNTRRQSS